jgi:hypothetical protein
MRPRRLRTTSLVGALAVSLLIAGCSGDGSPETSESPQPSVSVTPQPSASPTPVAPYLKVPDGVELTAPGFALAVGERATVAWELPLEKAKKKGKKRKKKDKVAKIAVVSIRVDAIESATLKAFAGWDLKKEARRSNPFFVRAKVLNLGETNLSGVRMPVYIVDGTNTLIRSSIFQGDFKPCPDADFPKKFKPGEKAKVCLVYLSPDNGRLTAVSFRPIEQFNPITWTGEIVAYVPPKKSKKGKKDGKRSAQDE